ARIRASEAGELYRVYQQEIDAADVGVAQSRKRVFLIAIRTDLESAGLWTGVAKSHHRDVLLHQQWVTGSYWERHALKQPEIPPRLKAQVERIRKTGAPPDALPWKTLRDLLVDVPDPAVVTSPDGWPNHIAIPGARTYAKHNGSPMDMPSKTIKAGVH